MTLHPLNTYVVLEKLENKTILDAGEADINAAHRGRVVADHDFSDVRNGDIVHYVWNSGHGQEVTVPDPEGGEPTILVHVKHEHLLSVEV